VSKRQNRELKGDAVLSRRSPQKEREEKEKKKRKKKKKERKDRQKRGNHVSIASAGIEFSCGLQRKSDKDGLTWDYTWATRDNNINFMNNINGGLMERVNG